MTDRINVLVLYQLSYLTLKFIYRSGGAIIIIIIIIKYYLYSVAPSVWKSNTQNKVKHMKEQTPCKATTAV